MTMKNMITPNKKERVSIVLPTYNERDNIEPLINRLIQATESFMFFQCWCVICIAINQAIFILENYFTIEIPK